MSDTRATPPITVVTVVRNGEATLEACIQSVLAQDVEGLEYLIIDGASTDGTLAIVERYRDRISRVTSEPDRGLYDAMNKGLAQATGRFVHFLNADDRYAAPDTLRRLLPELDANCICHAQMVYVLPDGGERLLGEPFSRERELRGSRLPQPVLFVATAVYAQVGGFDTTLRIAADYDMVLRLTARHPTRFIAQTVTTMHAGGLSWRRPELAFRESMLVARRHGRGAFASRVDWTLKHLKFTVGKYLPSRLLEPLRRLFAFAFGPRASS